MISEKWSNLAAMGLISMAPKPKKGRPRIYTDEQRIERQRERERVYNRTKRVRQNHKKC